MVVVKRTWSRFLRCSTGVHPMSTNAEPNKDSISKRTLKLHRPVLSLDHITTRTPKSSGELLWWQRKRVESAMLTRSSIFQRTIFYIRSLSSSSVTSCINTFPSCNLYCTGGEAPTTQIFKNKTYYMEYERIPTKGQLPAQIFSVRVLNGRYREISLHFLDPSHHIK